MGDVGRPPDEVGTPERAGLLQLMHDLLEDPEGKRKRKGDERWFKDLLVSAASIGVLAVGYMAVSTGLITFNKYFMHEGRFPYVIFLGMLHMSFSFLCNFLLLQVCPSLYPALSDPNKQVHVDRSLFLQVLLPIAACFGAQLVLSNMAFMHSSLAFLQMMKQSNVVLVYLFSLPLALEQFSWKRGLVLVWIVGATGLTVHGELNFSPSGFGIQSFSMLCESLKLTLQSYSLSAAGRRLDALTFVMLISPLVLLLLLALLVVLHFVWPDRPEALMVPSWAIVVRYWWLLFPNGFLAFAMNVAHALLIKRSSATAFILIGVVMKDVAIVAVGAVVLGEPLSRLQVVGFVLQLLAILVWSLLRPGGVPAHITEDSTTEPSRGWDELHLESGKSLSPAKDLDQFGQLPLVGAHWAVLARRPVSPSFCSNESTMPPLNELESCCPSAEVSPGRDGLGHEGL